MKEFIVNPTIPVRSAGVRFIGMMQTPEVSDLLERLARLERPLWKKAADAIRQLFRG